MAVKEIYSNGNNQKIGNNVSILNLPPIKTCTNCATCAGTCYARFRYQYPNVKARWDRNLEMTQADNFVELSTVELHYKATPIVRAFESGDFYSDEFIDKMFDLAVANPQIKFYAYTKNKNALKLNALANWNVIYSFIVTPNGREYRNYGSAEYCNLLHEKFGTPICPHDNTWKEQGKKCMIDCQECLSCDSMCFVIHGNRAKKDEYEQTVIQELREL